ncbi:hypothetical protein BHE74_00038348 [Ensete ventricosum]|nr:hypothetical protein GW17_00052623 [Ensete ventricosum]RWW55053.1 hypothetical protein BHE74_00038348 [Ensete ventricosum]
MSRPVYCCIAQGNRAMCTYNSGGPELEILAAECLENAPAFHAWYFHTTGVRTVGFLIADGYTYLAILDPGVCNLAVLQLLENIRDAFMKAPENGLQGELVSVIEDLIASLEYIPQSWLLVEENCEGNVSDEASTSRKEPPPLRNDEHYGSVVGDDKNVKEEVATEPTPLQRSLSSSRPQLVGRELWWPQVKIIIATGGILCLILFVVWLAVCKGLHCVSL